MEFVNRNSFDVRAAVYRLTHPDYPLEFELLPMVHLASPGFYAAMASRIEQCDAILFEGVQTRAARALTLAYELAANTSRLGLVLQRDALRLGDMSAELIHADVSKGEFKADWRDVPFGTRLLVTTLAPLVGLALRFRGTRAMLARSLQVDDLSEESAENDDAPGWDALDRLRGFARSQSCRGTQGVL